jgi:putative selenium metabolism protein SsnA
MLITNAKLITWTEPNQVMEGQALYIRDGVIVEMGNEAELKAKHPADTIMDARGQYVMPGNICAHTHFYGAFARGLAIPGSAPHDFLSILGKLWWPLDQALDEQGVRLSALVCLVDAIRHGTTTLFDHHASPNFIDGSLDVLAQAVDVSGLRAVLCYEVTDRNGTHGAQAGMRENVRFIERVKREAIAGGRVQGTFGLHASMTLTDETLEYSRQEAPGGTGFHIHVAEGMADQEDCLQKHGVRVVERLHKFNMLGPESIFVHAVHIDPHEVDLLAQSRTWVTHQPRSNMNNAVGIGDVGGMIRAGVNVCLGNDGFSNTMWSEWKSAYLVHKAWNGDPRAMSGNDIVEIAVYNNAAMAEKFFPGLRIGTIVPGAVADLIFVDYHPFTPMHVENLPWHILFGFHESMITTTMVNGQVLMSDRKLVNLDEEAIAAEAREYAPRVWERYRFYVPV